MKKKIVALIMSMVLAVTFTACGSSSDNTESKKDNGKEKITIAYQSSIAYAPILVMMNQKLIEKHYDGEVNIDWQMLANGAAINEGLTSGSVDIGCMGAAPAITGIKAGIPGKIFSGISSQPYGILTNQDDINSLKDITDQDQIAITGLNSHPHILLAMAAKAYLGDAHALDGKLTVLSNADGYTSLLSGAVQCHMVISPYNFMEEAADNVHEIEIGEDVWPNGNTFIVGVASNKLKENKPELYQAVCDAMEEAMEYIKENPQETAEILSDGYDATADEILSWMNDLASSYTTQLQGIMDLANFMVEAGFLENGPKDISEIAFDNVKGN